MAKNGEFAKAYREEQKSKIKQGSLKVNDKFFQNGPDDIVITIPKGKLTISKVGFAIAGVASLVLLPVCAYSGLSAIACAFQASKFGLADILTYGGVSAVSGWAGMKLFKGAKYCYGVMNGIEEEKSKQKKK